MKQKITLIFLFLFLIVSGQSSWKKIDRKNISARIYPKNVIPKKHFPKKYDLYSLALNKFKTYLKSSTRGTQKTIELPVEGKLERFSITKVNYLEEKLAKKHPSINSYNGISIDNPNTTAKISIGSDGIHAIISRPNKQTIYIDPYSLDRRKYMAYRKNDLPKRKFSCNVINPKKNRASNLITNNVSRISDLKVFRIAIACTNEYGQYQLDNQNIPVTAPIDDKETAVLSAINTMITRINSIYERDLSIRLVLVADNDKIINFDINTNDNLDNNSIYNLHSQNQNLCISEIGSANFDIGHIVSTAGGGLATLTSVCNAHYKAKGASGENHPINDAFQIDVVSHELGHQFGATHSFGTSNGHCGGNRAHSTDRTSTEPGSGTTIMGYAGVCGGQNVQNNSDAYFSSRNIEQIRDNVNSLQVTCETDLATSNTDAPIADAGNNYNVPKSTPLLLKGKGSDANDTNLTFCWEQIDSGKASTPPSSSDDKGPVFRSFLPSQDPNRYLPNLYSVINNTFNRWEILPSVERELNFSLTVRDNHTEGGAIGISKMKINVKDVTPFEVTSQNTPEIWNVNTNETITWKSSSTFNSPINCKIVTIKLSTDGGLTFPFILAENIPNNGSFAITVPDEVTTEGRIIVEAADNIFYNVNTSNFEIIDDNLDFRLSSQEPNATICAENTNEIKYKVKVNVLQNGLINFELDNLPQGFTGTVSPQSLSQTGEITITLNPPATSSAGNYNFDLKGTSATLSRKTELNLNIKASKIKDLILLYPENNDTKIKTSPNFNWNSTDNVDGYTLMLSKDPDFNTILFSKPTITNSFNFTDILETDTKYYWKVKAKNLCKTDYSPTFSFTTEGKEKYCKLTYPGTYSEYISNVSFKDINSTSGDAPINGYEDFTNLKTKLERGKSQEIKVSAEVRGNQVNCFVFIDWNQNYIFDTNERYDIGQINNYGSKTVTKNIKVPISAQLGKTRMRVIVDFYNTGFSGGNGNPCQNNTQSDYGETEDYSIFITAQSQDKSTVKDNPIAFINDVQIAPNPVTENTINFYSKYFTEELDISLYDVNGRLIERHSIKNNKKNKRIRIKEHRSGIYFLIINAKENFTTKKIILK